MVERRLIGTVLIAFALSTAAFSFILGERVEEDLEILKDEWNLPTLSERMYRLPTGEGRYAYGLGLVARKPIGRLEIFFATLKNESALISDTRIPLAQSPWESFLGIPEAGPLASVISDYGNYTGIRLLRQNLQVPTSAGMREGFLVDLTEPDIPTAPRGIPRTLRTVHAILLDEDGAPTQYLRGYRDFFIDRDATIIDLSVQRNNNLTKYAQRTTEQGTGLSMEVAPPEGHLVFDQLETDDQIFVSFAINPAMVTSRENIIHIVLIYVNGDLHASLVNTLRRSTR